MSGKSRYALYLILTVTLLTLAGRQVITQDELALWANAVALLLGAGGLGLAAHNVPGKPEAPYKGKRRKEDRVLDDEE